MYLSDANVSFVPVYAPKCGGKIVKMKRREGKITSKGGEVSAVGKTQKNPNRRRRQLLLWGFV